MEMDNLMMALRVILMGTTEGMILLILMMMENVIMKYFQMAWKPLAGRTFPLKNANPLLIALKMTIIIHGKILLILNTVYFL